MRETRFLVITTILLVFVMGCAVHVHNRDQRSIDNSMGQKILYQEDIARAAGVEDPSDLTADLFPVGDLTYDEYEASLGIFDSSVFYEEQKEDKGGNKDDD